MEFRSLETGIKFQYPGSVMIDSPSHPLSVSDILRMAGGAVAIERESQGGVKTAAAYKWVKGGIPDRHWPLIIRLSGVTADALLAANVAARSHASPPTAPNTL